MMIFSHRYNLQRQLIHPFGKDNGGLILIRVILYSNSQMLRVSNNDIRIGNRLHHPLICSGTHQLTKPSFNFRISLQLLVLVLHFLLSHLKIGLILPFLVHKIEESNDQKHTANSGNQVKHHAHQRNAGIMNIHSYHFRNGNHVRLQNGIQEINEDQYFNYILDKLH